MPCPCATIEEHELPSVEAVLVGTLALMTGYSQALQADLNPAQRLHMGVKIGENLALLAEHPALSEAFQRVLLGLRARWRLMSDCTAQAAGGVAQAIGDERSAPGDWPEPTPTRFSVSAPRRLQ